MGKRLQPPKDFNYLGGLEEDKELGMEEEEIKRVIMEKQKDKRISCKAACDIADLAGVPPRKVGKLLDTMKIKIYGCQLGCFD